MGHLVAVKDRQATTDDMFEPLKQTIELLKTYEQEMPEEVHMQLQELPEQWNNTKKISITTKQQVAPLHANEVSNIRKKSASFDVEQHKFREKFRQIPPFRYNCEQPYQDLDKVTKLSSVWKTMIMNEEKKPQFLFYCNAVSQDIKIGQDWKKERNIQNWLKGN